MNVRSCCCLKPRAGAIFVGILDFLIGVFGIGGYVYLKYFMEPYNNGSDDKEMEKDGVNGTTTTTTTTTTVAPTAENTTTEKPEYHGYYRDIPMFTEVYGVFALLILAAFALILFAVWKKSAWAAKSAFYYTLGLILLILIATIGYFVLGYHWHLIAPLDPILFLQIYFAWVLFDYTKYFDYSQPLAKPRA